MWQRSPPTPDARGRPQASTGSETPEFGRPATHPIPSGTRDVLPDEMRELRAITGRLAAVFAEAGYGEVATPALEYEAVLARGGLTATLPSYRHFDEQGRVLVLRSDMTVPIARVVATRFRTTPLPLRLCYLAPVYRAVRPQRGQARELLQAGIELVGAPAPAGTAEALVMLCRALEAVGLVDFRVGLGSASLYPTLLDGLGVSAEARAPLLHELVTRDLVGLAREVDRLALEPARRELLVRMAGLRGGLEVLDQAGAPDDPVVTAATAGLRAVHDALPPNEAARVIFDLGLARSLGYYTGAVFEVYDPALGVPLGGGGRYDDLLGRFGRPLPAVGFALNVERVHIAASGVERHPLIERELV